MNILLLFPIIFNLSAMTIIDDIDDGYKEVTIDHDGVTFYPQLLKIDEVEAYAYSSIKSSEELRNRSIKELYPNFYDFYHYLKEEVPATVTTLGEFYDIACNKAMELITDGLEKRFPNLRLHYQNIISTFLTEESTREEMLNSSRNHSIIYLYKSKLEVEHFHNFLITKKDSSYWRHESFPALFAMHTLEQAFHKLQCRDFVLDDLIRNRESGKSLADWYDERCEERRKEKEELEDPYYKKQLDFKDEYCYLLKWCNASDPERIEPNYKPNQPEHEIWLGIKEIPGWRDWSRFEDTPRFPD